MCPSNVWLMRERLAEAEKDAHRHIPRPKKKKKRNTATCSAVGARYLELSKEQGRQPGPLFHSSYVYLSSATEIIPLMQPPSLLLTAGALRNAQFYTYPTHQEGCLALKR